MAASAQSHSPDRLRSTTATEASCVAQSCTFFSRATSYPSRCGVQCPPRIIGGKQPGDVVAGAGNSWPSMPLALHRAIASFRSSSPALSSPIWTRAAPRVISASVATPACRGEPPSRAPALPTRRLRHVPAREVGPGQPAGELHAGSSSEPAPPRPTSATSTSPSAASLRCVTRKRPASLAEARAAPAGHRGRRAAAPASAGHAPRLRSFRGLAAAAASSRIAARSLSSTTMVSASFRCSSARSGACSARARRAARTRAGRARSAMAAAWEWAGSAWNAFRRWSPTTSTSPRRSGSQGSPLRACAGAAARRGQGLR